MFFVFLMCAVVAFFLRCNCPLLFCAVIAPLCAVIAPSFLRCYCALSLSNKNPLNNGLTDPT